MALFLTNSKRVPRHKSASAGAGLGLLFFLLSLLAGPSPVQASPVNAERARQAADQFAQRRFSSKLVHAPRTLAPQDAPQVEALSAPGEAETLAYIAKPSSGGFVLMRPDDRAPPVKLYSESGSFEDLPPAFKQVILLELAEENLILKALPPGATATEAVYGQEWSALSGNASPETATPPSGGSEGLVLVPQRWNQNSPYNYYAPAASGGPGGKAYIGCTATALGQILRYHAYPPAVLQDYSYQDASGVCVGTNTISSAGLGAYDWANMPASINGGSPLAQRQAIGLLLYHAAVALESNFEANGTGAYPSDIPYVLSQFFNYDSGSFEYKSSYTSPQWYQKLAADIDAGRPVFYAMWQADWTAGHAVVCDGYRNSNEIHLNLGWSGSGDAWYNIDSVAVGAYNWTRHSAVTNIQPIGVPVLAVSPPALSFGTQALDTSQELSFTVENTGAGTLSGSVSVASPFLVVSGGSYSLAAGQSQAVTVRFIPGAVTSYSSSATFTGGAGATRTVSGSGIEATATPTATATATATSTATATATPSPTATTDPAATPTATPTSTWTATPTPIPSSTPTPLPTSTATPTPTWMPTGTATPLPTSTSTPLSTYTPAPQYGDPTPTPNPSPTDEPENTPLPVIEETPEIPADLVVPSVRAVMAGNHSYMQVSFSVKNQYGGHSEQSAAGIYLLVKSGRQYRSSRVKLQTLPEISSGSFYRGTARISVPAALRRSRLAVKVVADVMNDVAETNERNNAKLQVSYSVLRR